jgi:ATP-dependent Clp protease protease subunit
MLTFNKITEKKAEISIYGEIGENIWGEAKSASEFKKELDNLGEVEELNVRINSPGGSIFDGLAIYNILKRHKSEKTVYIDGLAASAASFIAMAGDKVVMPKNSYIMIHNAWSFAMGNKDDLRKMADTLEQMDGTIIDIYHEKTKKDKGYIKKAMQEETWMNGSEAIENGFADEIEEEKKIAAFHGAFFIEKYKNIPEELKNIPEEIVEDTKEDPINDDENRADIPEPVTDTLKDQDKEFSKIKLKLLGGY